MLSLHLYGPHFNLVHCSRTSFRAGRKAWAFWIYFWAIAYWCWGLRFHYTHNDSKRSLTGKVWWKVRRAATHLKDASCESQTAHPARHHRYHRWQGCPSYSSLKYSCSSFGYAFTLVISVWCPECLPGSRSLLLCYRSSNSYLPSSQSRGLAQSCGVHLSVVTPQIIIHS